jgi:hypothetical protein
VIPESAIADEDDTFYGDDVDDVYNPFALALASLLPVQDNIIDSDVVVVDSDAVVDVMSKSEKVINVNTKKERNIQKRKERKEKKEKKVNLFFNPEHLDAIMTTEQKIATQKHVAEKKQMIYCSPCMNQATGKCTRPECSREHMALANASPMDIERYVLGDPDAIAYFNAEAARLSKLPQNKIQNRELLRRNHKLDAIVKRCCFVPERQNILNILSDSDFPPLGSSPSEKRVHFKKYPDEFIARVNAMEHIVRYDKPVQASQQSACGHEYTVYDQNSHQYVIVYCNQNDCPYMHVGQLCPCPRVVDESNHNNDSFPKLLSVKLNNFECVTCQNVLSRRACAHASIATLCVTCKQNAFHNRGSGGRFNGNGGGRFNGNGGGRPNSNGGNRPNSNGGGGFVASR